MKKSTTYQVTELVSETLDCLIESIQTDSIELSFSKELQCYENISYMSKSEKAIYTKLSNQVEEYHKYKAASLPQYRIVEFTNELEYQ